MRARIRTNKALSLILGLLLISLPVGCASIPEEHKGAAVGAGAGAATGAVAGAVLGGGTKGTVIGGLLGGLLGGAVGHYGYDRKKDREETAKTYNYESSQGTVLTLENAAATPRTVAPGETVELQATYAVLTPSPDETVAVQEIREVTHKGKTVGNPSVTVDRTGGTYTSKIPIRLPENSEAGTYEVTTIVKSERAQDTRQTQFQVR